METITPLEGKRSLINVCVARAAIKVDEANSSTRIFTLWSGVVDHAGGACPYDHEHEPWCNQFGILISTV
jgi:hypothetical protein